MSVRQHLSLRQSYLKISGIKNFQSGRFVTSPSFSHFTVLAFGDARITASAPIAQTIISEHIFTFLRGASCFCSPPKFHPAHLHSFFNFGFTNLRFQNFRCVIVRLCACASTIWIWDSLHAIVPTCALGVGNDV